jgi:hypothetical protein
VVRRWLKRRYTAHKVYVPTPWSKQIGNHTLANLITKHKNYEHKRPKRTLQLAHRQSLCFFQTAVIYIHFFSLLPLYKYLFKFVKEKNFVICPLTRCTYFLGNKSFYKTKLHVPLAVTVRNCIQHAHNAHVLCTMFTAICDNLNGKQLNPNISNSHVLPAHQCITVFCVYLASNSDYFPARY